MAEPREIFDSYNKRLVDRGKMLSDAKRAKGGVGAVVDKVLNRKQDYLGYGFKHVHNSVENPLGMKPTKLLAGTVAVGALGFAVASGALSVANRKADIAMQNAEEVGNLAAMSYDAVGNMSKGKRDLGATGDIVFGMYNARKGGM